jgi:hypothetical protein
MPAKRAETERTNFANARKHGNGISADCGHGATWFFCESLTNRTLSYRRSSAFIGGPLKNVLALGNTPTKIYSPPINADERRLDAVGFKLYLHGTASDPSPQSQIVQSVQTGG